MAFLKTPASWGLGRDRKRPSAAASAPGALNAAAAQGESSDVEDNPPLPLIGHLPIARQLRILRWTLALVFMGIVLVGVILLLLTNRWTSNLGAAAEMRVLSQKIAKSGVVRGARPERVADAGDVARARRHRSATVR